MRDRRDRRAPRGRRVVACTAGAAALIATTLPIRAQEEETETGWSFDAELSVVMAAGNAESTTLGAGAGLRRVWERSRWRLEAGGLRSESADITRRAIGTAADFEVVEESESRVTAENYYARTRFDRSVSERTFVYGGTSWVRNTFAGVDSRLSVAGGGGLIVADRPRTQVRVDLGGTYTVEDPVVATQGTDRFFGLRFSWDMARDLTETTELTSVLVVDQNLNDSDDLRGDFTNAIAVSISEALALRASLQLLYDAQPSLTDVPLFTPDGEPAGQTVQAELDELDSLLSVAVVFRI